MKHSEFAEIHIKIKDKGYHRSLLEYQDPESAMALLPIGIFIVLFVGAGVISGNFYLMPTTLAFLLALFVALLQNRKFTFDERLYVAASGAGDMNIITMVIIYLMAGMFSALATEAGGVASTVNFALTYIPAHLTIVGLFVMGCFISLSMGTSCGTIAALCPIAVEISHKTGYVLPLCVGAVVSGAMFGDNLSMISDTTIAAVRTQGCEMKDKFKQNFWIVLPAAIVTAILLYVMSGTSAFDANQDLSYNVIQILPYMFILIGALCGLDVFLLLGLGAIFSIVVGVGTGSLAMEKILPVAGKGLTGMFEISMIAMIAACISKLVRLNGGFRWILAFVKRNIGSYKGAQFGIGSLVVLMDLATANNTIAIVLAAPLAKQISEVYHISAKRCASILDTFSSVIQGLIPYGAQLMIAAGLAAISPVEIMPYCIYPLLMFFCIVGYIIFFSKAPDDHAHCVGH